MAGGTIKTIAANNKIPAANIFLIKSPSSALLNTFLQAWIFGGRDPFRNPFAINHAFHFYGKGF
jgi:hypothetical protein